MLIPVILAGGSGTRLWPASRNAYPKQFLCLLHENLSLFQQTILRLDYIDKLADPIIICNEEHRFIIAEQLRALNKKASAIILEPVSKNTSPAIALALKYSETIFANSDEINFLVLPADHEIKNLPAFQNAILSGIQLCEQNKLITFGIKPLRPETGYGYIKKGSPCADGFEISSFIEKPPLAQAELFVQSGEYLWNSGMFLFNKKILLAEMELYAPKILDICSKIINDLQKDLDFVRINKNDFNNCPNESIDNALMEKTKNAAVISLDACWNDIGAWDAIWKTTDKDKDNNVLRGNVFAEKTSNSLVHAQSRLVATLGVEDHIIIETADAVLVAHKNNSQDVKELVLLLQNSGREEATHHKKVFRPWGWYESICNADRFQVKRIIVSPKNSLSLQMHHHRAEHWIVVKGTAKVTNGNTVSLFSEDQSTYIPIGEKHRLENPGTIPLEIIEIQTGAYLGEDDIIRFEDIYNR